MIQRKTENFKKKLKKFIILIVFFNYISLLIIGSFDHNQEEETNITVEKANVLKEKFDLYKYALRQQNISKFSISCKNKVEQISEFFPKSFSERHFLFKNFYLFNWTKKNSNFYDLRFDHLMLNQNESDIFNFLKKLKFCTINKFSKHFNASHSNKNFFSKMLNNVSKVKLGGYYRPHMCLQEFIYFNTNDTVVMKLKLILDNYNLTNDSQNKFSSLIKDLSLFAYKIIRDKFSTKSGRQDISKFIYSKENELSVVVIPYLNRKQNLIDLMINLHPFLQRQFLHYSILVVEQTNLFDKFNKGRLYNAAFNYLNETFQLKKNKLKVSCVILQDVDLIPESDYNIYGCDNDEKPRHLSLSIRKSLAENETIANYTKNLYELLVGGVLAISPNIYSKLNGFSNEFWNWGGEDDGK